MSTKPYTLKTIKGIKTIIYPIKGVETVRVELVFKTGSFYESGKKWGGLHFLEHLMNNGTKDFPTEMEIGKFEEKHGLVSNAYTGGNRLGFFTKGPHYSLEAALKLINQFVFHPLIKQSNFTRELNIIENEYKARWDNKYTRFYRLIDEQHFGKNHLYIRDGIGQVEYIKTLSRENVVKLHRDNLVASNANLVVVGKVDPKKVENLVSKIFNPPQKKIKKLTIPPIKSGKRTLVHYEDVKQEEMFVYWPIPGRTNLSINDRVGIGVFNYILGGGNINSILFKEIRQKHGLAYKIYSRFGFFEQAGYFGVWTNIKPENHDQVLKLIRKSVYDLVNQPVNKKRFKEACDFSNSRDCMDYDSVNRIAGSLIGEMLNEKEIHLSKDYAEITNKIAPESIRKLMQKYINPKNELIAIMKNKDSSSKTKAPPRK